MGRVSVEPLHSFAGAWIRRQIDQLQLPLHGPDALHDRRVAARRLRVACDLFWQERLVKGHRRELKGLTRIMGSARQWDVQEGLLARLRASALDPTEQAALEVLQAKARKRRKLAWETVRNTPIPKELIQALKGLARRVEGRAEEGEGPVFVEKALQPLLRASMGRQEELYSQEDPDRMHQARKAFKRLRYALELLQPALAESQKGLLDHARDIQTQLGDHHDLVALQAFIEGEGMRLQRPRREALLAGIKQCLQRVVLERQASYQVFLDRHHGGAR